MSGASFVYVTYIRTTPERLWDALTNPEITRQYRAGTWQESDWEVGSPWKVFTPDGRVWDTGYIIAYDKPRRLLLTWRNEHFPEMTVEGYSRLTLVLEAVGSAVKLSVTHELDVIGSKLIDAVSMGWPMILASVKSLLETGVPIEKSTKWPEGL